MLTSDLAINWKRKDKMFPFLIKTGDAGYLRDASELIEIFDDFVGQRRALLEAELEEFVGTGTNFKVLRGFIKLLTDRCDFETASVAEPAEIRRKVFLEARKFQPVLPGSAQKQKVFQKVAAEFETDPEKITSNLYSDLSGNQKLSEFESMTPPELLDRFNLGQAQAILYKCVEMKIAVSPSKKENYRSIFGWIKHFGLIHSIIGDPVNGYEITLTGAASLFHRSQKYGIQMSVFLPALLLCENWEFRAEIASKNGRNLFYELTSGQNDLNTYYLDQPDYINSDIERLKKSWKKTDFGWLMIENESIIDLGKTAFIPDFVLQSPKKEKIYLDVLGFWTPKILEKRLEEFSGAGFKNFILAAGRELRGTREEPLWENKHVLFYKSSVKPMDLLGVAENLLMGAGKLSGKE